MPDYSGPYETMVWYEPQRDRIMVKIRRWDGDMKTGMILVFREDDIRAVMEKVPVGGEYPTYRAFVEKP